MVLYPEIGGILGCGHGRSKEAHELFSPAVRGTLLKAWPGIEGQPLRLNYSLGENQWTGLRWFKGTSTANHSFYH